MAMLKYVSSKVDNKCLEIVISDDTKVTGTPLFIKELKRLLTTNGELEKVVFIGANSKPSLITYWTNYVFKHFNNLEIVWKHNLDSIPSAIPFNKITLVKLNS